MWLAANDKTRDLPEGFTTIEDLKVEFAAALAQCGRAHNWDNQKPNAQGKMEYYDDERPDSRTCSWGVGQRVVQFLMLFLNDKPETRVLAPNFIVTKFKETLIAEGKGNKNLFDKLNALSTEQLKEFKNAFNELCIENFGDRTALKSEDEAVIQKYDFSKKQIDKCIQICKDYYSEDRITAGNQNIKHLGKTYDSYEAFIEGVAGNWPLIFADEINAKIKQIKDKKKASAKKKNSAQKGKSKASADPLIFTRPQLRRNNSSASISPARKRHCSPSPAA